MGDFGKNDMIARDGQTVLVITNAFGQEWQVLNGAALFRLAFPSAPAECIIPTPKRR
jgi:hypothetical protein